MIIFDLLGMLIAAYIVGFLYYGLYRNITARFQRRIGPTVLQSFFDSIKFFSKKESISHGWMFYLGPVIMATGAMLTLFFIPFFYKSESFSGLSQYGNLFVVLYLMMLGPLGNAMGVGVSGSPFACYGNHPWIDTYVCDGVAILHCSDCTYEHQSLCRHSNPRSQSVYMECFCLSASIYRSNVLFCCYDGTVTL